MQLKKCNGCHAELALDAFGSYQGRPHARGTCRRCNAASTKRWRERNVEAARAAGRAYMSRLRSTPEGGDMLRARERASYKRNVATARARYQRLKETDFFRWKARKTSVWLSADELRQLWDQQGGRCALTGRLLDRTAQLDHKIPRSRGGQNAFSNTQWLAGPVNQAKRNLLDHEFIDLCREVVAWADRDINQEPA